MAQRPQLRSVTIVTDEHTKETNLSLKSDHLIRKKIGGRDFTYIYFSLYIKQVLQIHQGDYTYANH